MIRRLACLTAFVFAACDNPPPAPVRESPAFPERPPVVVAPPVQTIPYEDGYALGFAKGRTDAKPKDPVPLKADADTLATEAAGTDPDHNEKWRSGWSSGYLDGFRQIATGAK
jgi:hypothetical protein